jgi:hypothetical protein
MTHPKLVIFVFLFVCRSACAQPSVHIKVHYLHGSRPAKQYKKEEPKYFGGIHGGHYGIELADGRVVHFRRKGKLHLIAHRRSLHSCFRLDSVKAFYGIYGGMPDSMQRTIFTLQVPIQQYAQLEQRAVAYCTNTPYDYAFFGMRCSAATWQLLGVAGVVQPERTSRLWWRMFRPAKLYRKLTKSAEENGWEVERQRGTKRRKWRPDW